MSVKWQRNDGNVQSSICGESRLSMGGGRVAGKLGVYSQEFFALIPGEHVGSVVVYAWKVDGCDVDVRCCDKPQAPEQVHHHAVFG